MLLMLLLLLLLLHMLGWGRVHECQRRWWRRWSYCRHRWRWCCCRAGGGGSGRGARGRAWRRGAAQQVGLGTGVVGRDACGAQVHVCGVGLVLGQSALLRFYHPLETLNVFYRMSQRVHLGHLLLLGRRGDVTSQHLEAPVDLFNPVPLPGVPPRHLGRQRRWDCIAQGRVEGNLPLVAAGIALGAASHHCTAAAVAAVAISAVVAVSNFFQELSLRGNGLILTRLLLLLLLLSIVGREDDGQSCHDDDHKPCCLLLLYMRMPRSRKYYYSYYNN